MLCYFSHIPERSTWVEGGGAVTSPLHRIVADGRRRAMTASGTTRRWRRCLGVSALPID